MARIAYTAFVSSLRGRYAGTQFRYAGLGGSGTFHPQPVNSHSKLTKADAGRVSNIKNNVSMASSSWADQSNATKNAWIAAAAVYPHKNRFGVDVTLSGFQLWMLFALNNKFYFNAVNGNPPVPVAYPSFPTVSASYDPGSPALTVDTTALQGGNWFLAVYASTPRGVSRGIRYRNYKFLGTIDFSAVNSYEVTTLYNELFGAIPSDSTIDFKVFWINELTLQQSAHSIVSAGII